MMGHRQKMPGDSGTSEKARQRQSVKRRFVQAKLKGDSHADAYAHANPDSEATRESQRNLGYLLNMDNEVQLMLLEARKHMVDLELLDAQVVLSLLYKEATTADRPADRTRALELLGKNLSLFKDKIEIETTQVSDDELAKAMAAQTGGDPEQFKTMLSAAQLKH